MRIDKQEAETLRRKGLSYRAIKDKLGIPISTLSGWFKNSSWSIEIKRRLIESTSFTSKNKIRLMAQANKRRWQKWHDSCRENAITRFPKLKKNPIFLAGLMLYWGEGDKQLKNSVVRLTNSDPDMIRLFYRFLTKSVDIPEEKIYTSLLLYPDLIDSVQKNFWSRSTGISELKFKKSVYIKGGHSKKRLSYGVCTLAVNSRELKEKIMKWLELYKKELMRIE